MKTTKKIKVTDVIPQGPRVFFDEHTSFSPSPLARTGLMYHLNPITKLLRGDGVYTPEYETRLGHHIKPDMWHKAKENKEVIQSELKRISNSYTKDYILYIDGRKTFANYYLTCHYIDWAKQKTKEFIDVNPPEYMTPKSNAFITDTVDVAPKSETTSKPIEEKPAVNFEKELNALKDAFAEIFNKLAEQLAHVI